jgi:hypothetical protein
MGEGFAVGAGREIPGLVAGDPAPGEGAGALRW